jgi:DNA gyrase subunit A
VDESDQILMVTDQGQLIRTPVRKVRLASRNTQGVIVFRTAENEHVVSVERLADTGEDEADEADEGGEAAGPDDVAPGEGDTPTGETPPEV